MSRGRPTFTESIRAMSLLVGGGFSGRCAWEPFGHGQVAIGAVRKHRLTRLETDLDAVDFHGNDVRLEGHEVGDAGDLGIRLTIRPRGLTRVTYVVVAAQPLVRAEGLLVDGSQRGLVDAGACHVPSRREARFVEHPRSLRLGDDAVPLADHEMTGGLPDVDAMVTVRGMPHDSFVFFVEGVHGPPGERDPRL